jgi:hypothetical protein
LTGLTADGSTGLYDGLLVAAGDLQQARKETPREIRDAIIVL